MKYTVLILIVVTLAIVPIACNRFASSESAPAISDSEFSEMIGSAELTLVKFGAPWCGPCKMVDGELDQISDRIQLVKVNVDNNGALADQYNVSGIPHLILFRGGKQIDSKVGFLPATEIMAWADKHRSVVLGEVQANPFAE